MKIWVVEGKTKEQLIAEDNMGGAAHLFKRKTIDGVQGPEHIAIRSRWQRTINVSLPQ